MAPKRQIRLHPGERHGALVVLSEVTDVVGARAVRAARCRCDCGAERVVRIYNLVRSARPRCVCQATAVLRENGGDRAALFWSAVTKTASCWLFTKSRDRRGYGRFRFEGRDRKAHHVSWFLSRGRWPTLLVLHHCDNPPCVNPAHLFEGDHRANVDDMLAKNRNCRGEQHSTAKLTDTSVREMRLHYARGEAKQRELAERFGVHQSIVSEVLSGKRWRHVT